LSTIFEQNLAAAQAMIAGLAVLEPEVTRAAGAVADTLLSGHKLLACGNGGSAADASHLTTEFVGRYDRDRRPYPAISLATHGGDLTAIANDYTFDELFARQVRCFAQPGDLLIVFTTSGQSENVYRALLAAREMGVGTIAFLGRDGGRCAGLSDVELIVREAVTARIQEAHKLLLHTICEMVEQRI
jgi:phosphoheptose isomerase